MRLPDAISSGSHVTPEVGMCVMETVAYVASERHSDHPQCACPVITEFAICINDAMPDDATRTRLLGPLVWRIGGTRSTRAVEQRRAYMLADWAVREVAPLALDAAGMTAEAGKLRSLAPVVDVESARVAYAAANAAYYATEAAAKAAKAANAANVAYAAAYAAAYVYATYAVKAAFAAAKAATVEAAWEMCADILGRLCDVTEEGGS